MLLKMCFEDQFCVKSDFQSSDCLLIEAHSVIFNSNVSFLNQLSSSVILLSSEEHCFYFDCIKLSDMSSVSFFSCFCCFLKSVTDLLYQASADHNFNVIHKEKCVSFENLFLYVLKNFIYVDHEEY